MLGLTYREGVKELAYSRALPLIERLRPKEPASRRGTRSRPGRRSSASGASPWTWAIAGDARAIVAQTADPVFGRLDAAWFPDLEVILDGRNSLRGVPTRPRARARRRRSAPGRGADGSRDAPMTRHRCPQDHAMKRRGLTLPAHPDGGAHDRLLADTAAGAHDSDRFAGIE